ncbi:hypothetical protein Tco_1082157 [Tanacetum coccineum]|uniref:Uncharacterized protein n=1 Tax=Tanacetum coccineum TaxID=301880 RepID=A0ABQ5I186_9ASTR
MSGPQDEIPPLPPPPPSSSQTPTQPTPHTVSTIKLPILKKGEYDIWAMKMEHYLAHTDYTIWEKNCMPEKRRKREKLRDHLAIWRYLEDHLAKFHKMTDAKEMWDAIKSRFGGNDESKKMQKRTTNCDVKAIEIKGLFQGLKKVEASLVDHQQDNFGRGNACLPPQTMNINYMPSGPEFVNESNVNGSTIGKSWSDAPSHFEEDYPHRALKNKGIVC